VIQDADVEYDPNDWEQMYNLIAVRIDGSFPPMRKEQIGGKQRNRCQNSGRD
jgi:hypothetical protein